MKYALITKGKANLIKIDSPENLQNLIDAGLNIVERPDDDPVSSGDLFDGTDFTSAETVVEAQTRITLHELFKLFSLDQHEAIIEASKNDSKIVAIFERAKAADKAKGFIDIKKQEFIDSINYLKSKSLIPMDKEIKK